MDIGKQIAKYRKERHITQEQLGEAVGVTNRTVSKWEHGVSLPGIDLVPRIASALDISLEQFFGIKAKENAKDLSQIVRNAVSEVFEDSLYDAINDALDELLPQYMDDSKSADGYSLLVFGRGKEMIHRFRGEGTVEGPFCLNGSFNKKYGIVPQTIKKPIENNLLQLVASYRNIEDIIAEEMVEMNVSKEDLPKLITKLEKDMHKSAKNLDFERAAEIRDKLKKLREMLKDI